MKGTHNLRLWLVLIVLVSVAALASTLRVPLLHGLGNFALFATGLALLLWLLVVGTRRLLWRVGRRLAITYVLIGALPVLLITVQIAVGAYLIAGLQLGHLFRSGLGQLASNVSTVAATAARAFDQAPLMVDSESGIALAYYRDGLRVGGDPRAPSDWPEWLESETTLFLASPSGSATPRLVAIDEGKPTVATAIASGRSGVVGFLDQDLEQALSEQSGVWTRLLEPSDAEEGGGATIHVLGGELVFSPFRQRTMADDALVLFYRRRGVEANTLVMGLESPGPIYDPSSGEALTEDLSATLNAPLAWIVHGILPSSPEVDTIAWIAFVIPAFLLFDVYLLAAVMAIILIVSLSRAVNRLSTATNAVQSGDFSVRIPVRRRDQVGELQQSFNAMAANLETLIDQAATKELLDKELEIARELQEGLLPGELTGQRDLQLATYFEPSAVIGGDFFDVRSLPGETPRTVVVIADVSGHGIPAALRMTMLKAALDILIQEGKQPEDILASLDTLVRTNRAGGRTFVTATLAILDLESGTLELTNAGHPPTYLLRQHQVEEIALTGTPLGALGHNYGHTTVQLESGDVLVWLSDGLIEATDTHDDSFGFERTAAALGGSGEDVQDVRDRLVDAVRRHCGEREPEDDRTMVVLRYVGADLETRLEDDVLKAS